MSDHASTWHMHTKSTLDQVGVCRVQEAFKNRLADFSVEFQDLLTTRLNYLLRLNYSVELP